MRPPTSGGRFSAGYFLLGGLRLCHLFAVFDFFLRPDPVVCFFRTSGRIFALSVYAFPMDYTVLLPAHRPAAPAPSPHRQSPAPGIPKNFRFFSENVQKRGEFAQKTLATLVQIVV